LVCLRSDPFIPNIYAQSDFIRLSHQNGTAVRYDRKRHHDIGVKMEYPKIQSLWKREGWYFDEDAKKNPERQSGRQSFIIGDYAAEEFRNIKMWHVTEKIDGMNIRVYYKPDDANPIEFKGRTNAAQMPPEMQKTLEAIFTKEKLAAAFGEKQPTCAIFYGEGYGPKIQSGGYYAKETGFVLFDIWCAGWWLERDSVENLAEKLSIPVAPYIGTMDEYNAIEFVKSKPLSAFAKVQPHIIEGIVCRSHPLMLFRRGDPIMWKLKCKEFL
jgi:hypothetical protein